MLKLTLIEPLEFDLPILRKHYENNDLPFDEFITERCKLCWFKNHSLPGCHPNNEGCDQLTKYISCDTMMSQCNNSDYFIYNNWDRGPDEKVIRI
jgi:hypothetical protein